MGLLHADDCTLVLAAEVSDKLCFAAERPSTLKGMTVRAGPEKGTLSVTLTTLIPGHFEERFE